MSCMSESERIRRIQEQANKYISRNKCVDSSLLTMKRQAQASSVTAPTLVSMVGARKECDTTCINQGKGTNMDYTAIMQKAASCAVCSDTDTSVTPYITLVTPCINNFAPPFTQQNLSTMYVTPCTDPGNLVYFPPAIYDGSNCTFNRNMTPS
jgi:hypothetical protein